MTDAATAALAALRRLADAGWLRQLDWALAQFVARRDPEAAPEVLVATALLAQLEGHGHSCLPLALLGARPLALPGWPADGQEALGTLLQGMPRDTAAWRREPSPHHASICFAAHSGDRASWHVVQALGMP